MLGQILTVLLDLSPFICVTFYDERTHALHYQARLSRRVGKALHEPEAKPLWQVQ
jgi:hypothetical protein